MSEAGRPAPSPEISPELQAMNAQNAQTFQETLQKVVATESDWLKQPYTDALNKVGSSLGDDEAMEGFHEGINTEFQSLVDAKVQAEIEDRLDTGRFVGIDAVPADRDFRKKATTPEPASPAPAEPGGPEPVRGHTVTDRRVSTRMAEAEAAAAAASPEPAAPTPTAEPASPEPGEPASPAPTPADGEPADATPTPGEPSEPTPAPAGEPGSPEPASSEPSDPAPTPAAGEPAVPVSPEPGTPEPGEPTTDPESKWETGLDKQLAISLAPVQQKLDEAMAAASAAEATGDEEARKAKAEEAKRHSDHIQMLYRERDLLRPSQVIQDRFDDAIDNIDPSNPDESRIYADEARHLQAVTASQERWSDRRIRREGAKLERFIKGEQTRRERARAAFSIRMDRIWAGLPEQAKKLDPRKRSQAVGAAAVALETNPEPGDGTGATPAPE